ncbi:MAG: hypothetical protein HQL23_01145 [Candidatus Omnitrophica bacterium]|nr:hypothetical protein [Candidatus Omnitrophota bacterium]
MENFYSRMAGVFRRHYRDLYAMASLRFSSFERLIDSHFPTWFIIVGYPLYWLELFVVRKPAGHTSFFGWAVMSALAVILLIKAARFAPTGRRFFQTTFNTWPVFSKIGCSAGLIFMVFILGVGLKASLYPPHLPQEYDALNYHITIPRQHLINHSYQHLKWSAADLMLMPVDYALAPFVLATKLPNKIPQYFFVLGLLCIVGDLAYRISRGKLFCAVLAAGGFLGQHMFGIQIGTAMLDLVIAYLFFAAVHSFRQKKFFFAAIELTFYYWSKGFMPVLLLLFVILSAGLIAWLSRLRFVWPDDTREWRAVVWEGSAIKKFVIFFGVCSLLVAGPFLARSLVYAGTPLFPFAPGIMTLPHTPAQNPQWMASIRRSSAGFLQTRDDYGDGRSFSAFVKHMWLIAVPEKGVNNRYDYPVGLIYLLCVGPFLAVFFGSIRQRKINILYWSVVLFWGLWWYGSHQTRFLYVPLGLMILAVVTEEKFILKTFISAWLLSIVFTAVSVYRSQQPTFALKPAQVLRTYDQQLLKMSRTVDRSQATAVESMDAAYADFPISVKQHSAFVILPVNP